MIDHFFVWRGVRPSNQKVILVALDDDSLRELRPKSSIEISPELAEVVTFLAKQKAAAIGVDYIISKDLEEKPGLQKEQIGDLTKMGEAVKNSGNVVLSQWLLDNGRWEQPPWQWLVKYQIDGYKPTDLAFVDLTPDPGDVIRRQLLIGQHENLPYMNFALALAAVEKDELVQWTDDSLSLANRQIPLDEERKLRINFVGPPGSVFSVLPFHKVLAAARNGGEMELRPNPKGAIVIIGAMAESVRDYHTTPYARMSGSELMANMVATLVDQAYIWTLPSWVSTCLLLVTGALLGAAFGYMNLLLATLLAVVYQFAWIATCFGAFKLTNARFEVVPMLIVGALVYAGVIAARWRTLQKMVASARSK